MNQMVFFFFFFWVQIYILLVGEPFFFLMELGELLNENVTNKP